MDNIDSKNLTLEDIARLCGVSRSTVSRVVNHHPNVSTEIRQRVLQTIEKTGYLPNEAARTLASQRSWMIGLVVPRNVGTLFIDPYFAYLIQGIAQTCTHYNYTLGLFMISNEELEDRIFPRISRNGMLDGIIIQVGQLGDRLTERLVQSGIPLVIAGRPNHPEGVSFVDIDNVSASHTAVSHLIRLGRKRIAMITGPLTTAVGLDRMKGYRKALEENNMAVDEALIAEGDFTENGGYSAMKKLLSMRLDAVFSASDAMAIGAIRAVRENNLKIPQDIAFVGFDDLLPASYKEIQLTTIRQPVVLFGERAVEMLVDQIERGVSQPRHVIMDTELIIRKSCGAYQL